MRAEELKVLVSEYADGRGCDLVELANFLVWAHSKEGKRVEFKEILAEIEGSQWYVGGP